MTVVRLYSERTLSRRAAVAAGLALLFALSALAPHAHAAERDYVVELVLFEHVGGQSTGGGFWYPTPRRAVTLGSEQAAALGIVQSERPRALQPDADAMVASGRYRVLQHYVWQQPGLADADAVSLRVNLGGAESLWLPESNDGFGDFLPAAAAPRPDRTREIRASTVSGYLRLRLGRFLHLDADLVFTDRESGRSYRLEESRKMRSRELHYIDNPRIGMLVRIVPADQPIDDVADLADELALDEPDAPAAAQPVDEPVDEPGDGPVDGPVDGSANGAELAN